MKPTNIFLGISLALLIISCQNTKINSPLECENRTFPDSVWIDYEDIGGIGYEEGVSRRDPSDIIKVGDTYYIWYTKIPMVKAGELTRLYNSGYYGTIWYAVSNDGGHTWTEKGEALGPGPEGAFDSHAVFTPNILYSNKMYFLFYTAVKPTPGNLEGIFENNSTNDFTAIGIAASKSPDGPFVRTGNTPALSVSSDPEMFDSYRVDDAALLYKEKKYWFYYKGRALAHGPGGPAQTRMGLAFSEKPEGPYTKYGTPILDKSHEVLIWNHKGGTAAMASLSSSLEFAADGIDFKSGPGGLPINNRPSAPGLYRPHLTDNKAKSIPGWGISMGQKSGHIFLKRFEIKTKNNTTVPSNQGCP